MRVTVTKKKTSKEYGEKYPSHRQYSVYLTLSKNKKSKLERKVLRALYLSNASLAVCVGALPEIDGRKGNVYFKVDYKMPDEKFYKNMAKPLGLTSPEVRKQTTLDRKKEEEIEFELTQRQHALARDLGLYKLVPKDLRPKFSCRCGVLFKKKIKLLQHQRLCTVIAEAQEIIDIATLIMQKRHERDVLKKKAKRESKIAKKKSKTSKRKSLPSKISSKKSGREKAAKVSQRKTSKRKQR